MIATSKLPDRIASRYVPVRLIGKGGMGVVYEVEHAWTGEHLALKLLLSSAGVPREALERFKREARAPAQIKSENVVRVTDADVAPELDDAPFLVMELLEGMDLEKAASHSNPDRVTVVGWLRQIAPAIDKAHRLGIIHRDLKPENLFLATFEDRPPVVKILDFGIAKMAAEGNAATVSGEVLGTPRYMAPEQAARHPRITPATDRYALGLIAYRLLVGECYHRGDVMSILAEILHGPPIAPSARNPSLGNAFDAWFFKACHREPERRFASAVEQMEALAEALGLPSASGDAPRERLSSSPRSSGVDLALPATISHRSVFRSSNTRRTLTAGALLIAAGAAALWYRASPRIDVPSARVMPATLPAERGLLTPTAATEPSPGPEAKASSLPSSPTWPEVHATTSASSFPKSEKSRPRPPGIGTVIEPPKAPAPDPFKDQK
jgi:serine/threonine protein kinase